jgi:hypothetical protein
MKIALILSSLAMLTASASVADRNPPTKVPILKDTPKGVTAFVCPRAKEGYFTEMSGVLQAGGEVRLKGPCFGQTPGLLQIYIVTVDAGVRNTNFFGLISPTRWSSGEAVYTIPSFDQNLLNFKAPEKIAFQLNIGSKLVHGILSEEQFAALQRGETLINPPRVL